MLNDYFDHVYVINLDSRPDRLREATNEFNKIGASFSRVVGVDGYKEGLQVKPYKGSDPNYWNAGALGLVRSTIKILEHAMSKNYDYILICEDDIEFDPDFNKKLIYLEQVPDDWQMFLFGTQHMMKPERINERVCRVSAAFCLHCYAVKSDLFDYYLYLLKKEEKELDHITLEDLQPLKTTYSFSENIAFQRPSFSDIQKQPVDHSFLRDKTKFW